MIVPSEGTNITSEEPNVPSEGTNISGGIAENSIIARLGFRSSGGRLPSAPLFYGAYGEEGNILEYGAGLIDIFCNFAAKIGEVSQVDRNAVRLHFPPLQDYHTLLYIRQQQ